MAGSLLELSGGLGTAHTSSWVFTCKARCRQYRTHPLYIIINLPPIPIPTKNRHAVRMLNMPMMLPW